MMDQQENILLKIRGEGLADENGQLLEQQDDKVLYVVHPNCPLDDE